MQKRNILSSPRLLELKRKKRNIFVRKITIFMFLFLAIIALLSYLSRIQRLNISEVEIVGNKIIETEFIKKAVQKEISGKYVWLFPKANIFFYPKGKIKNELSNQFKRLKDITLSIENRKTLIISVAERIPKYTWCGALPVTNNNVQENCYFLDEEGYIFDEAPYFSGEVYFKFYGFADLNNDNPSGSYFFQPYFNKLILFKEALENIELKPAVLYVAENGDIKIFLSKVKAASFGPEIIFKKDSDFQKIAENLKAALNTEPLKSEFKSKYASLQYIDLRFENKVYYKFSNQNTPALSGQ